MAGPLIKPPIAAFDLAAVRSQWRPVWSRLSAGCLFESRVPRLFGSQWGGRLGVPSDAMDVTVLRSGPALGSSANNDYIALPGPPFSTWAQPWVMAFRAENDGSFNDLYQTIAVFETDLSGEADNFTLALSGFGNGGVLTGSARGGAFSSGWRNCDPAGFTEDDFGPGNDHIVVYAYNGGPVDDAASFSFWIDGASVGVDVGGNYSAFDSGINRFLCDNAEPLDGFVDFFYAFEGTGDGEAVARMLETDPYAPFRQRRPFIVPVAGSVTLVVDESVLGHTLDASALTQAHSIQPAEAEHAHTLDGSDLTQAHSIQPAESEHTHTVDGSALTQAHVIAVAETLHAHLLDASGLTQAHAVAPGESVIGHLLDASGLTQSGALTPAESAHEHSVDSSGLTQAHDLAPDESQHAHAADASGLTQASDLAPDESAHTHTADETGLTSGTIVEPADSEHAHTADAADLTQANVLAIGAALHAHAVDEVALTQAHAISVAEAVFAHTLDSGDVSQAIVVAVNDALHSHSADASALSEAGSLAVAEAIFEHLADPSGLTQASILTAAESIFGFIGRPSSLNPPLAPGEIVLALSAALGVDLTLAADIDISLELDP